MFALPSTRLFSYTINLILKIEAAIQIGNDEYPPIPITIAGLLNNKYKKDLIIEKIIINVE